MTTEQSRAARHLPHIVGLALASTLLPNVAFGQGFDGLNELLPMLEIESRGWSQLSNTREMLDFLLALVEVAVLTFVVSLHPVNRNSRISRADFDRPRTMFLYALIGMVVGFLVLHHGYIIGFVVFGVGGLLRFRAESTSTPDTTRLILMTLLGLCVGLDLPVIAFLATLTGWIAIYAFSRHERIGLDIKFTDESDVQGNIDTIIEELEQRGFKTVGLSKTKFKPFVELVIEPRTGLHSPDLMRNMADIRKANLAAVDDWHIS